MQLYLKKDSLNASWDGTIDYSAAERDIDLILWTLQLHNQRRYHKQRFWEDDSRASDFAQRVEGDIRLESVSEHSWHVGYIAGVLSQYFPELDRSDCLEIALIHDVLEIITGDKSPLGRDGTGRSTHAFNTEAERRKTQSEEGALSSYLARLPTEAAERHQKLVADYMFARTAEAQFIKAVDKLQCLAYVHVKKDGRFADRHLVFTLNYWMKGCSFFPALRPHFDILWHKLIKRTAKQRQISERQLAELLRRNSFHSDQQPEEQLSFFNDTNPT